MSDNKTIAKNTIFLYFRMFLIMGISLYTSRITLNVLGEDNFGIYNVVGGIVLMFTFINGALAASTSRFITYEIGRKNYIQLIINYTYFNCYNNIYSIRNYRFMVSL